MTPLQWLPKNVGDLGELIVAQSAKIAQSGHTDRDSFSFALLSFQNAVPMGSVVILIKHFTIVIYNSRVVLTRKLPILRL